MSWHTNALLINRDYSGQHERLLEQLGLTGAESAGPISWDEAASFENEGVGIASGNGWTALFGGVALFMVDDEALAKIAKTADVFQMMLAGSSDTAGFTVWRGGKVIRDWLRQQGDLIKNEGPPLPAEKKAFAKNDDEGAVLDLLSALTLPSRDLAGLQFELYSVPDDLMLG